MERLATYEKASRFFENQRLALVAVRRARQSGQVREKSQRTQHNKRLSSPIGHKSTSWRCIVFLKGHENSQPRQLFGFTVDCLGKAGTRTALSELNRVICKCGGNSFAHVFAITNYDRNEMPIAAEMAGAGAEDKCLQLLSAKWPGNDRDQNDAGPRPSAACRQPRSEDRADG